MSSAGVEHVGWTVIGDVVKIKGKRRVWCRCGCGIERYVRVRADGSPKTQRCHSCTMKVGKYNFRHGQSANGICSPTYISWVAMLSRCSDPNATKFARYGGRGIVVCERWKSFENFLADMGERPPGTSIDRVDLNGNYEPGNCRWATDKEQCRNRTTNKRLTLNGKTLCVAEWSELYGLPYSLVAVRLRSGWTLEEALSRPSRDFQ